MRVSIDTSNAAVCAAASVFFASLAKASGFDKIEVESKVDEPVIKIEPAIIKVEEPVKKVEETPKVETPRITKTAVKALLAEKREINPGAIKAKLTELGVSNVAKLDLSKCAEFHKFLEELKPAAEPVASKPVIKPTSEPTVEPRVEGKVITKTDVRKLLNVKGDVHRKAIIAKLGKLGAKSVTLLDDSKCPELYKFLEGLESPGGDIPF